MKDAVWQKSYFLFQDLQQNTTYSSVEITSLDPHRRCPIKTMSFHAKTAMRLLMESVLMCSMLNGDSGIS